MAFFSGPVGFFRHLAFFALLGFAAVFLTGPIVAVISLVFSLAITVFVLLVPLVVVGLLIWIPVQVFARGKQVAFKDSQHLCRKAFAVPYRNSVRLCSGAYDLGQNVRHRAQRTAGWLKILFIETVCGALVGALLGGIASFSLEHSPAPVFTGVLVGGFLGIVVGVTRLQRQAA
jgi:hypothetical protein